MPDWKELCTELATAVASYPDQTSTVLDKVIEALKNDADQSEDFWLRMLAKADARAEKELGPRWIISTTFRAHTEDQAKAFRENLQLFMKDFARQNSQRLDDLLLARIDEGNFIDVID